MLTFGISTPIICRGDILEAEAEKDIDDIEDQNSVSVCQGG